MFFEAPRLDFPHFRGHVLTNTYISAGRNFLREYYYFLVNMVILLIFALERNLLLGGGRKLSIVGRRSDWGLSSPVIQLKNARINMLFEFHI